MGCGTSVETKGGGGDVAGEVGVCRAKVDARSFQKIMAPVNGLKTTMCASEWKFHASVPSCDLAPWRGIRDMSRAKKIDTSFLGQAPKSVIAVPIFGMDKTFCMRSWRRVLGCRLRYALDGWTLYKTYR